MRNQSHSAYWLLPWIVLAFAGTVQIAYAQEAAASAPVAAAPAAPANVIFKPVPAKDTTSLFFSADKMNALRDALNIYNENLRRRANPQVHNNPHPAPNKGQPEDYLTALTKNKQPKAAAPPPIQTQIFSYPQFYMEFLMFHSESSWMVLLNGQRFASDIPADNTADLRVLNIQPERVVFEWKPKNMDRIRESWDGQPSSNVSVDFSAKTVTFALRLNQTFSSYLMKVVEGKVTPVQSLEPLAVTATEASAPAPAQIQIKLPPAATATPPAIEQGAPIKLDENAPPAKNGEQEGLGGLLNSYKEMD